MFDIPTMRMWMTPPQGMCSAHLLGEHRELHTIVGSLRANKSWDGYIGNGLVEFYSLAQRHRELVKEIERRGYNHMSPLEVPNIPEHYMDFRVDRKKALQVLVNRCPTCRRGIDKSMLDTIIGDIMQTEPNYHVGDKVFYFSYGLGEVLEVNPCTIYGATSEWQYKIQFEKLTATLVDNPRLIKYDSGNEEHVQMANQYTKQTQLKKEKKAAVKEAKQVKSKSDAPKTTAPIADTITLADAKATYPEYAKFDKKFYAALQTGKIEGATKVGRTWRFPAKAVEEFMNSATE